MRGTQKQRRTLPAILVLITDNMGICMRGAKKGIWRETRTREMKAEAERI